MDNKFDVIVIGAGPSGMMAAGTAAKNSMNVLIIERNNRVGKKLMITGKGRCNITNNCDIDTVINSVPCNGKFLYSALSRFSPKDTMKFFESLGLELKTERGNRVFPSSDRAIDVVNAMEKFIKQSGCNILNDRVSSLIIEGNKIKGVKTYSDKIIYSDNVIIACGGKSYPLTGSTGDGYKLANEAGHTIIDPKPSLVPLVSSDNFCSELQGLSLKNVSISVVDKHKNSVIFKDFGELIFTHFGLSGPIILSASAHMKEMRDKKYKILIDLKPALNRNKLDLRIQRDFSKYKNKDLSNALCDLLPKKLIPVVIDLLKVDGTTKCNQITREMRYNLVSLLKEFTVNISSFRPIEEAIITSGGIKTQEIDPKTMQSKLIEGLYFAGEVIDVDAYTGGFNLQIAFCTGNLAGNLCN